MALISGPQPFWLHTLRAVAASGGGGRGWFYVRNLNPHIQKWSFAYSPITRAAQFSMGHGPVAVQRPGIGDHWP